MSAGGGRDTAITVRKDVGGLSLQNVVSYYIESGFLLEKKLTGAVYMSYVRPDWK